MGSLWDHDGPKWPYRVIPRPDSDLNALRPQHRLQRAYRRFLPPRCSCPPITPHTSTALPAALFSQASSEQAPSRDAPRSTWSASSSTWPGAAPPGRTRTPLTGNSAPVPANSRTQREYTRLARGLRRAESRYPLVIGARSRAGGHHDHQPSVRGPEPAPGQALPG